MKTIQITLNPLNWAASTLTATGVTKNGKTLSPAITSATLGALPPQHAATMAAILDQFLSIDPGGKTAVYAQASLESQQTIAENQTPQTSTSVRLTLVWNYPDQTTETEHFQLHNPEAINLVTWLLSAEAYSPAAPDTSQP